MTKVTNNTREIRIEDRITLQNDRLKVEIGRPGALYEGPRFDWTGMIAQVTLDGVHTFCARQDDGLSKLAGIGLCNEFGLSKPVGYEESEIGGNFPKIGVGLLIRDSAKPYFAGNPYGIQRPDIITMHLDDNAVQFISDGIECNGYATTLVKTISLLEQSVNVHYRLYNKGDKPIDTHEYAHNFISIDNAPAGPDYRLKFPYKAKPAGEISDVLRIENESVYWNTVPDKPFSCEFSGYSGTFQWELEHIPSGAGLREILDVASSKVALWGKPHVICAEAFVDVIIPPGSDKQWSRCYDFYVRS